MKIGIDISQVVYEGTGVAEYVKELVIALLQNDSENEYVLFFTHIRADKPLKRFLHELQKRTDRTYILKRFRIPISIVEWLWNSVHIVPIEWLIGKVDIFFTSDWVEPPTVQARKITTIHDLSVLKVPETFDSKIVSVHTRKLRWVVQESEIILCDSQATLEDSYHLLGIEKKRLRVLYPGIEQYAYRS